MLAKALGENGKQGRIAGRVQRDPPSRSVRADRVPTLPDAAAGRLVDGCAPPAAASSPASAQAAADSAKTGRTPATSSARCKTADAGTVAADVIRRTRARASIDREVSKISTRCTTVILPARALRRRDRRPEIFAGGEIVAFLRAPRAAEITMRDDDTGDAPHARGRWSPRRCVPCRRSSASAPGTAHGAAPSGRLRRSFERSLLQRFRGQLGDNREFGGLEIRVAVGLRSPVLPAPTPVAATAGDGFGR